MVIIFDEADLCVRNGITEGDLCRRDPALEKDICTGNLIDVSNLRVGNAVDQDNLCALNSTRVDQDDLCTEIGINIEEAIYRFDTTRITLDNTSLDWSYSK